MNATVQTRLRSLRQIMKEQGLAAYYIQDADYHLSEYVGEHFQFRTWMSGFTGSAGTLVVLLKEAGLWTDGRYFLQAEEELEGTGIDLYRMQIKGVPTIEEFLAVHLPAGSRIGVDGRTISAAAGKRLEEALNPKALILDTSVDLTALLWENRPELSGEKIWRYEEAYAGRAASEKLTDVRGQMKETGAQVHLVCALDEIAWLFNLRGSDVQYNPVFLAYAVIEEEKAYLFADIEKMNCDTWRDLEEMGVEIYPYDTVYEFISRYDEHTRIMISDERLNHRLYSLLKASGAEILSVQDPVILLKAVKNETEIRQSRQAHRTDGVIMVRFMKWLKEQMAQMAKGTCKELTEAGAAAYLDQMRKKEKHSLGLSFETICGYGAHGAVVHYAVTEQTNIPLRPKGLLLVDSGGQYLEGTTDITRTFALGELAEEERTHFTLVLKCMLRLMSTVFPEGVCCHNLDVLAREPLWQQGLDYRHGTGHGVGHLLNVHEGPNSFHWKLREGAEPVVLKPGMVTTDEPGIYIPGKHGIRLENELLCCEKEETEYGKFLCFESLTLAPIDLDAVNVDLLDESEKITLNAYHRRVYEELEPELTEEERKWLAVYTRQI